MEKQLLKVDSMILEAGSTPVDNSRVDAIAPEADNGEEILPAAQKAAGETDNDMLPSLNPGSGGAYQLVDGQRIKTKE